MVYKPADKAYYDKRYRWMRLWKREDAMGWLGLGAYDKHDREDPAFAVPKKGAARFLQLLLRDLWEYVKANLLCVLCFLPAVAAGGVALALSRNYALCCVAALACAFPAGGGLCGLHRVLNRSVRDMGEPTGLAFRRGFQDNFRAAALPGALVVLQLLLSVYLLLFSHVINAFPMPGRLWTVLLLIWAFLQALLQYCFPLMVVLDLPLRGLLRNGLRLVAAYPKRGLLCFFVTALLYAAQLLLFPVSLPVILLMGVALMGLVEQLCSWEAIDHIFHVSEQQQALHTPEAPKA